MPLSARSRADSPTGLSDGPRGVSAGAVFCLGEDTVWFRVPHYAARAWNSSPVYVDACSRRSLW